MLTIEQLDTAIEEWLSQDQDPETRSEIISLRSQLPDSQSELSSRFSSRIQFGTAGLRARMQAGPNSMNSLVVIQATQGVARYAKEVIMGAREMGVVVGHDHRHRSERFASIAAGVFRAEGFTVYELEGLVHTPMVPFAAKRLGASLALMITASHNPKDDNGYKLYWSNHVQIIPPHDSLIATSILSSLTVSPSSFTPSSPPTKWNGTESMKEAYLEMAKSLCHHKEDNAKSELVFTYTAMHGVGLPFATAAFKAFGFKEEKFEVVREQAEPDPEFPTVKFPNPEEKGALDLAMAHADRKGSTIVLANDPDADRFCAAEETNGKWNVFTGDQLGALLGWWVFTQYRASGKPLDKLAMCASTVSSKMLKTMAEKEGFVFRETLTGFKFLGNEALELEKAGYKSCFAYEEAIGYMIGTSIRDKDGVTALATFCEMAASLGKDGKTVSAQLDALYETYGYFETSNSYFICRDSAKTDRIFSMLRFGGVVSKTVDKSVPLPIKLPETLAGFKITYLRDLTIGYDSSNPPSFKPTLPIDPSSHMISFALGDTEKGDGVRVTGTVRTSGTEPKIKFYLEASGNDRSAVKEKLQKVRKAVGTEWLRWEEFGLERA
ncbi:phosphoglucomutase, partial [Phenoliferia sp. Uapishka_3]